MESESNPVGHPCPITVFACETIRFNGHFMSRFAAMDFTRQFDGDINSMIEVGMTPTEDMSGCPVQALTDDEAFQVLCGEVFQLHNVEITRF